MKLHRVNPFKDNTAIKEGLHPMIYAYALTGDKEKAKELVALIKFVKEMGFTFTEAYDDERELYSATSKLTR